MYFFPFASRPHAGHSFFPNLRSFLGREIRGNDSREQTACLHLHFHESEINANCALACQCTMEALVCSYPKQLKYTHNTGRSPVPMDWPCNGGRTHEVHLTWAFGPVPWISFGWFGKNRTLSNHRILWFRCGFRETLMGSGFSA